MTEPSLSIKQVSEVIGATPRTIRNWIKMGMVPRPLFRGSATRYERVHLVRLLAIKKLRSDFLYPHEIRSEVAQASPELLEAWARAADFSGILSAPAEAAKAEPTAGAAPASRRAAPPSYPAQRWERIELLPGLELSVRDQPALRRIAAEIFEQYGPGTPAS